MHAPHPRKVFSWWLGVPGLVIAALVASGFARAHPYGTLAIVVLCVVAYLVFLRLMVTAPRGKDPEE